MGITDKRRRTFRLSTNQAAREEDDRMKISALCSKMEGLSAVGSSRSTYLKGERTVSAPRLVASNTPAALGAGRSRGRTPLKIVAARVAGVEIPNAKNLEISLMYIYGIGPTMAKQIMTKTGVENKRLIDIQCYRGKRHQMSLPVRGQKTKTNARTRKGKKKTVAGKNKK